MRKTKETYAIFKDNEKISEQFQDFLMAVLVGIERKYFEIEGGAKFDAETSTFKFDCAASPSIRYYIPKSPACYEIRKINQVLVTKIV